MSDRGKVVIIILLLLYPLFSKAQDLYDQALQEYRNGRIERAKEILNKKPQKNSGDYNLLGWILLRLMELQKAEEAFKKSLDIPDSYCGLGYVFYQSGDTSKALSYFEEGQRRDPSNRDCLEGIALLEKRLDLQKKKRHEFFALGDYFWIKEKGKEPRPLFIKGINIGFGMPGRFPSEFPEDETLYRDWFEHISEMGVNVIRVYTILPPEFYTTLKRHNTEKPHKRLFLIQGIWVELPEDSNFRSPEYLETVKTEIRNAIDVIHGMARIKKRPGHAHGIYNADISEYVLAFIFGREWEPSEVITFNSKNGIKTFQGSFLSIKNGNPFETWLTEMLDHLITYEEQNYHVQRPVAFMNWPTLDPLYHPSEATMEEEIKIRKNIGENISLFDFDLSKAFDDDAVSIDETKIISHPSFRAGIFASYHVYPYFPDFLKNEERYARNHLEGLSAYYYNYLKELKSRYKEIPLLISEFGLPTSRGIARFHPEGLNHGGLTEEEQAEGLKKLFLSIKESGCAGGIIFSWIDEWWKANWMTKKYEENDQLWYNAEDPEENYGIMAVLPSKIAQRLRGDPSTWPDSLRLYCPEEKIIKCLSTDSDEGYLYIKVDLSRPIEWSQEAILIGIDTFGDKEGDHLLPFNLKITSPVGLEYIILLHGTSSKILVDNNYAKSVFDPQLARLPGLTGYRERTGIKPSFNNDGNFIDIITVHRRRFSRDGKIFPERLYNASILKEGNDFYYSRENNFIELKIPWGLLNFSDPSQKKVIHGSASVQTEGIRFLIFSYKTQDIHNPLAIESPDSKDIERIIRLMRENPYRWNGWTQPLFTMRPKKAYYVMTDIFKKTPEPAIKIHLPEGFDFEGVIKNHYSSKEEFIRLYELKDINTADPYGLALAYLVKGIITKNPFYILKAKVFFSHITQTRADTREGYISRFALTYIENLLIGNFHIITDKAITPKRVVIKKQHPEKTTIHKLIIGRSFIKLKKGSIIKTQVDRVTRDWLSGYNATRSPFNLSAEYLVPWHEGRRISEILKNIDSQVYPVWGTIVKKIGNIWYGPDEKGIYRFPISEDKVYNYPSNIIIDPETVVINDTHGISAIAWDSKNADLVIGCGDHEGKIEAAYYLASKGINVYMPTDRFLSLLIGAETKGTIIGSAPIKKIGDNVIIGNQPIEINIEEPIVVSFSEEGYPIQYYDTPYRYFKALEDYLKIKLRLIPVNITEYGEAGAVVKKAREIGARLIGVRVSTKEEQDAVYSWLQEDRTHRDLLFHSAPYEDGYRLFFEFPEQTSFGDIKIYAE